MKRLTLALGMFLTAGCLSAKVTLPAYFSDRMVLQQKSVVRLHGLASPSHEVIVRVGWHKQPYVVQADAKGRWRMEIPTPKAGGPYDLVLSDGEERVLRDVFIGEVWVYAGAAAEALMPEPVPQSRLRVLSVPPTIALTPQSDLSAAADGWKEVTSETLSSVSRTAYHLAHQLQQALKVPVGWVNCTWADTPIEAWSSFEALQRVPGFEQQTEMLVSLGFHPEKIEAAYARQREAWYQDLFTHDMGWCEGRPVWAAPDYKDENWKTMELPGAWEDRGVRDFNGVMWFRKTVDIPRAWHRKELVLDLGPIADEDIVYFNGQEIGRGSGPSSRRYVIPRKRVRRGKAVLTVRVTNYADRGGFLGVADAMLLAVEGKKPLSVAGEWKFLSGLSLDGLSPAPVSPSRDPNYPTGLYNAMIHPLTSLSVRGVVWNPGSAALESVDEYADLQYSLIVDWRDKWQVADLPFLWVQAGSVGRPSDAPEDSDWALLREAQAASLPLNRTAQVVTTDLPAASVVPSASTFTSASTSSSVSASASVLAWETGFRLSQAALRQAYGKKRLPDHPVYASHCIEGNRIRVRFEGLGKGFAPSAQVSGFSVAGTDRIFYPAVVRVEKKEVVVFSPEVAHPVAVRYNWADATTGTLFGASGLPVAPFRTDRW